LLLSARAPAAAIDRYLLQARALSSKPAAHAAAAVDRRDRRTDTQPFLDPASHTMRAAAMMMMTILLVWQPIGWISYKQSTV